MIPGICPIRGIRGKGSAAPDCPSLLSYGSGDWITVLELAPGEYQYRLIVDGEWRDHSEAARKIGNPFGTQNAILIVA